MKNKIVLLLLLGLGIILTGTLGLSYALWTYKATQTTNNILKSGCFKLELTEEQNNINLQNTIPLTNSEGMKLTPYTFKVSNTCTTAASYEVNLESLVSSTLDSSFVRLSLNSQGSKLLSKYELNSSTIIDNAKESRKLDTGIILAGKSKQYSLRVWLDGNTTATSTVLGKTLNSKITISGTLNPDAIKVNLDTMGGEIASTALDTIVGSNYGSLPTPTKEGYYFSHWYLDNEDNKVMPGTIVERKNNHTLRAAWIEKNDVTLLKENAFNNLTDYKETTTEIKPYEGELTEDIKNNAILISDDSSFNKAYTWLDDTTLYYIGESNHIYMQNDSFKLYKNVVTIDIKNINTSLVNSMASMFLSCKSLKSLDVTNFNTSNVTDMHYMFESCESLNSLDVTNFDTSKVTDMDDMFAICSELTSINLKNFDTSNVTNMNCMFMYCPTLTELDVSSFDTSNVTIMSSMFSHNYNLLNLDISMFKTSNVKDMAGMFYYCEKLTEIDLSNFDTSKVTSMTGMFENCQLIQTIDLSNFNTSNVLDMSSMFANCKKLTSVNLSSFNTSKVYDMSSMFDGCSNLTTLDLSSFEINDSTRIRAIFDNSPNLNAVTLNCTKASQFKSDIESSYGYPNISISCI